jgi:7-cyano-7-deazaguanine reductase
MITKTNNGTDGGGAESHPAATEGITLLGAGPRTRPTDQLESFPNPHPHRAYHIHIESPEFTALCPITGQPDFATITLEYVPGPRCVELKAYKLYLWHFRNEGAFHEDVVNRILDDLVAAIEPRWARLTGVFNVRGGLYTSVVAEHGDSALATPYPAFASGAH